VHDTVEIEAVGLPMVFVASSTFVDAAEAQARALGADPACVFVPHPIQDRTDDEMRALADAAIDEIIAALTGD
jgi:alkanesulfonate monooxygenase SsuD/methylene tetrahydromethanopterin reductase-like flavin-dependent oxidoreductase (luciferase family)